jgi:hypothetical protein
MLVFLVAVTKIWSESTDEAQSERLHYNTIFLVLEERVFSTDARSDIRHRYIIDAERIFRESRQIPVTIEAYALA